MPSRKVWFLSRAVLLLTALVGLGLLNYQLTGSADQHNNDFSWFWTAGRLMGQGISPYDHSASQLVLDGIGSTRHDPLYAALAYPLWTIALFIPFGWLEVDQAAALWLTINEIMFGLSAYLIALSLTELENPAYRSKVINYLLQWGLLPFLLTAHFIRCLLDGQFSIVALTGVAFFTWATVKGRYRLAGLILLVILFKPTGLILFLPGAFGWLWWHKERRGGAYVFLAGSSGLLVFGFGLDWQMLSHMYEAATPLGRAIAFRNATFWGACATVARTLSRGQLEMIGWGLAALLGILAGYLSWRLARTLPLGPTRLVVGWSLLLLLSLNFTWYAFSYEAVALLFPLLATLGLIKDYSGREKAIIGLLLLIVLGIVPYSMGMAQLEENRAGLFLILMLAVLLGLLYYHRGRLHRWASLRPNKEMRIENLDNIARIDS